MAEGFKKIQPCWKFRALVSIEASTVVLHHSILDRYHACLPLGSQTQDNTSYCGSLYRRLDLDSRIIKVRV